jgi:hypothetical protein
MNGADGIYKQGLSGKLGQKTTVNFNPGNSKGMMKTRKDIMTPFRTPKKYAFYWKMKKQVEGN